MRYYYLIDDVNTVKNYVVCFSSKKAMLKHVNDNNILSWHYVVNKAQIPKKYNVVIGNNVCKDYNTKDNIFVIKNSLKDRRN